MRRLLGLSLVCATACSLLSLDELRGTTLASDASDASDASELDSVLDARDVKEPPFCSRYADAAFCADFDQGLVAVGWTDQFVTPTDGGASVSLSEGGVTAPSSSLHLLAGGSAGCANASLRKILADSNTPSRVHVEFDMEWTDRTNGADGFVSLAWLVCDLGAFQFDPLVFGFDKSNFYLVTRSVLDLPDGGWAPGPNTQHAFTKVPTSGVWSHIDLDIALSSFAKFEAKVDGVTAVTKTGVGVSCYSKSSTVKAKHLLVGPFGCSKWPQVQARYDNVLVTLAP